MPSELTACTGSAQAQSHSAATYPPGQGEPQCATPTPAQGHNCSAAISAPVPPSPSSTTLASSQAQPPENKSDEQAILSDKGGTHDLWFLPIPKRLQWDPAKPPEFTLLLNLIFGFAATFSVANLYYVQPLLIALARDFDVPCKLSHRIAN